MGRIQAGRISQYSFSEYKEDQFIWCQGWTKPTAQEMIGDTIMH